MERVDAKPAEWLSDLLRPGIEPRQTEDGYLDVLPGEQPAADPGSRSQSLWQSGVGPRVYLRLVQPLVRRAAAPPGAAELGPGLGVTASDTVLDVGCGPGVITAGLAGMCERAVGLDVSAPMLKQAVAHARPNMAVLRGDAQVLPFADETFDKAISTAVIMLLPDPTAALEEMLRVLRPGGTLAVVVACKGTGLTGALGRSVGKVAGGRMFAPHEIADLLSPLPVDRIRSQANNLISTTYARKTT